MLNGSAHTKTLRRLAAGLAVGVLVSSGAGVVGATGQTGSGQVTGIEAVAATAVAFDSVRSTSILAGQTNTGNTVVETNGIHRTSLVNSVVGNTGIVVINQDTGNFANQANIVAISIGATPGSVIDEMSSALYSQVTGNTAIITGGARSNRIYGSFGGSAGVFAINQSAGNFNNQVNAFALSLGVSGDANLIALADTSLAAVAGANGGQLNNTGSRTDSVSNSFDGFSGIGMVNQSAGDGNIVGSSISLSLQVTTLR